jgi:hypothetical protein
MKKIYYLKAVLMVFAISLFANNLFAQRAYININAGYGVSMSSQNIDYFDFYNLTVGKNSYTVEQVNVSLGKGLNFGGTFGYMFNENIGAELGISYLLGSKSKAKDEYVYDDNTGGTTDYTLSSKMLRFIPSFVISSGFEGINPYAKLGLVIGTGSIFFDYDDNDDGDKTIMKMKLNGGIALGLNAAIGAIFNINDNISLFGELNMVNLSYAPNKGETTELTYNGTDILPDLTTREKETEYVDSYTYNYDSPPPDSEPRQELKQKFPFGSFGINFGVRIEF